jgi:Tectonin domain/Ricin-type beta-trefoil lectin domain-like
MTAAPAFVAVSGGSDGSAYAVDAGGVVYQLTSQEPGSGSTWTALTSPAALTQVAVTNAGDVWGVTAEGAVYRSQGQSWEPILVPGQELDHVDAAADGTVWGVRAETAYEYTSGAWTQQGDGLSVVAVGEADGVFGITASGQAVRFTNGTWVALAVQPPVSLQSLSVTNDGLLWAIGTDENLYLSVSAQDPWVASGAAPVQISAASSSYIWALATGGTAIALQYGSPLFTEGATPSRTAGWETESVYDQSESTHLWIVYQAATLAAQGGSVGQDACGLVSPQDFTVRGPLDPTQYAFHNNLCQGLYDADFKDPWCDTEGWWIFNQATYKSHFFDPDTGKNWCGESDPTALTRGRGVAMMALDRYAAGDMANAGYYLGLALHYLTDAGQVMHAQNFAYQTSRPFGWHQYYEEGVLAWTGTGTFYVNPSFTAAPTNAPLDYFFITAATQAKKYLSAICPDIVYGNQAHLWNEDPQQLFLPMLASTTNMLTKVIEVTAQFLVAWTEMAQQWTEKPFALVSADTGGCITTNGSWLNQWPFEGSGRQIWWAHALTGADAGYYQLTWWGANQQVLDVTEAKTSPGSAVGVNGPNNGDNQKWSMVEGALGQVRFQGKQSGLYLTINEPSTSNSGLVIQQGPSTGKGPPGQNWIFAEWNPVNLMCSASTLVADVLGNPSTPLAPLGIYTSRQQANQTFIFVPLQDDQSAPDEQVYAILIANQGMAVDIKAPNTIVQNTWSGAPTQRWSLAAIASTADGFLYTLESVAQPNHFIAVNGDGTTKGQAIIVSDAEIVPEQQWALNPVPW